MHASIAKKTRFPTLSQLYSSRSGNIELEAESSINTTIGGSWIFGEAVVLNADIFHHNISDSINRDGSDIENTYQNYSKIVVKGIEAGVEYFPQDNMSVALDVTLNNAKDKSANAVTENVVDVPKIKADFKFNYLFAAIDTDLTFVTSLTGKSYSQVPTIADPDDDEELTTSFAVSNLHLSKVFYQNYKLYLEVDNIFDKNYLSEGSYPGEGRSFLVGLKGSF